MVSMMRIIQGQLFAAFLLTVTGIISVFRDISIVPSSLHSPSSHINIEDFSHEPDLSMPDYVLDQMLETKYTTTHQKLRGRFSLILNEVDGENGDNDIQHRGILRVSSEKLGKWPKIRFHPQNHTFLVGGENARVHGATYAKYVDDKRVVVSVNHTIIQSFPSASHPPDSSTRNGEDVNHRNHLCNLLKTMTRRGNLDEIPQHGIPPTVLNIDGDCSLIAESDGQGSLVLSLYGIRIAAATAKVDLQFQCSTTDPTHRNTALRNNRFLEDKLSKLKWVFPWFASYQSAPSLEQPWPYNGISPTHEELCGTNVSQRSVFLVARMANQIRSDVRKMAVTLVGSDAEKDRIHPLVPLDADPWIPNASVDDVIIYFPCHGDVSGANQSKTMGFLGAGVVHFGEYMKLIAKDTKTIGVITEAARNNEEDWCHKASILLVEHLYEFYTHDPSSRSSPPTISLYDNDSLPLQYARITMAKQSFGSFSAFPLIAIMGMFGEGYYLQEENSLIGKIASTIFKRASMERGFENLHSWEARKILSPEAISAMTWDDISSWIASTAD